jgi:hypothetical protein
MFYQAANTTTTTTADIYTSKARNMKQAIILLQTKMTSISRDRIPVLHS